MRESANDHLLKEIYSAQQTNKHGLATARGPVIAMIYKSMIEQIIIKIIISLPEILFIFGAYLLFSRIIFITKSRKVLGEVSGIEARQTDSPMGVSSVAGHRRAVFYPKIYYKDDNDRQYRLILGQVAKYLSYNTGDKVSVIYSASKPGKAFLNNIYCVWITPISYFCLGVALIIYKYIV